MIRALEFSQWLEVLGQLFQAMLKLLRAIQVIKIIEEQIIYEVVALEFCIQVVPPWLRFKSLWDFYILCLMSMGHCGLCFQWLVVILACKYHLSVSDCVEYCQTDH